MCKRIVVDVETDALLDKMTTVHCIVIRDLDDDEQVTEYFGANIFSALSELESADEVWGHNISNFDLPALRKHFNWGGLPESKVFDSLLASQLAYPDLAQRDYGTHVPAGMPKGLAGSHSLEAWGWRLGSQKIGLDVSFAVCSPELVARCVQDTALTVEVIRDCSPLLPPRAWTLERGVAPYLTSMEENGFHFDVEKAQALTARLRARQIALREQCIEWGGCWTAPKGKPFIPKKNNAVRGYVKGVPFQKYHEVQFNPNSRPHIAKRLQEVYGWNPEVWTEANNPKMDEGVLLPLASATLEDGSPRFPIVRTLLDHFEVGMQLRYVSDSPTLPWLKAARLSSVADAPNAVGPASSIHGRVSQMGTAYGRASHSKPNLGQVTLRKDSKGKNLPTSEQWFRELFYVPARINYEDWSLVGSDMSGIELRMLAHFAFRHDGGEYARIVLEGDVHQANADAWGVTRDLAKTGIYALIYGAGDAKLGRTLHPYLLTKLDHQMAGQKARKQIMSRFAGLGKLTEDVKKKAGRQGYLQGLDGRRLPTRAEHAALNNVLQCAGAVLSKQWIINFKEQMEKRFGKQSWRGQWAAQMWVHDENQVACHTAIAEHTQHWLVWGIEEAGRQFNLNVPITGTSRIGRTWAETH